MKILHAVTETQHSQINELEKKKKNPKIIKRQTSSWEEIYANHISDKRLSCTAYKGLSN